MSSHTINTAATARKGSRIDEALAALSKDLGHGDGRCRWVKSVYLRGTDAASAVRLHDSYGDSRRS
jgi:hypothetical protein